MNSLRKKLVYFTVILFIASHHYALLHGDFHLGLPAMPIFPRGNWHLFVGVKETYKTLEIYGFRGGRKTKIDAEDLFPVNLFFQDHSALSYVQNIVSSASKSDLCIKMRSDFSELNDFEFHIVKKSKNTSETLRVFKC